MKDAIGISAMMIVAAFFATPAESAKIGVTLSVNPPQPCLDPRQNSYLNFDLVIHNDTGQTIEIRELRLRSQCQR